MTMMEQAPRQVAVKVSPEGDKLITSGAHYLRMSKRTSSRPRSPSTWTRAVRRCRPGCGNC